MRTNILILTLVAVGCGDTHEGSGTAPVLDGDVEGGTPDSGQIVDESAPDAGGAPDADAAIDEHDPDPLQNDAAIENDAGDDAGTDAGEATPEDASVEMCTAEPSEPVTFGAAEEPIELALADAPFVGTIDWRGRAFARIRDVVVGERYLITVSAEASVLLTVLADDTTFTDAECLAGDDVRALGTFCIVTATRDSIDVAVDARNAATSFELTIRPAYAPEGTWEAPTQVAQSALPYSLDVSSEEGSVYEITGLTEGARYVVSVRGASVPVHLRVFGSELGDGDSNQQVNGQPHAVGIPDGTSLRVTVQALGEGTAGAELDVRPTTHEGEGTPGAPIQIAESALPFEGEVGWANNTMPYATPADGVSMSFYAITGLTPGAYVVSLGGVVEPVILRLWGDDGAFTGAVGSVTAFEGITAMSAVRIAGSVLYVNAMNLGGGGTPFTLDVEPTTRSSEGTENSPVEIALTELPYSGEIEPGIDSYYEITGLSPGQAYLARVADATESSVGVMLFPDSPFDDPVCEIQTQNDGSGSPCKLTPSGASIRARARVMGSGGTTAVGSVFALSLEPIVEASEGTPEAPIVIECPEGSYTGRVGLNGAGYYEITGLEAGTAYLVEAEAADDAVILQVFSGAAAEPFYDPVHCDNYDSPIDYPTRCIQTSASGSLFVQIIGYAYGAPLEISVRPAVSGSEGTQDAPIALELADLPYEGRVSGAAPSFYAVSGLDNDTAYIARVTTLLELLDFEMYSDGGVASPHGVALGQVFPGRPLERIFLPTDVTAYLRAALWTGADGISDVAIDLFEAPHQAEGVDTPLALMLAELPRTSSADAARVSRYAITGLTPGESYVATIANVSDHIVSMDVYEDENPALDRVCSNDADTGSTQECTFSPTGTSVRLEVRLVEALSASFELDVQLSE